MQLKKHPGKHHECNSVAEKPQMDDIKQALDSLQPEFLMEKKLACIMSCITKKNVQVSQG